MPESSQILKAAKAYREAKAKSAKYSPPQMNWQVVIDTLREKASVVYPYHKEAYEVLAAISLALERGLHDTEKKDETKRNS